MSLTNYPDGVDGTHDYFNDPDPPECPNSDCMATLDPDWEWCPYCGTHIDGEDADWYAEESEAFYRSTRGV